MVATMKALTKVDKSKGANIQEFPIPTPKDNEVLIKVTSAAICGTDLHIYQWDAWANSRLKLPLVFGHEFCGEVVETGRNVTSVQVGAKVTAEGHLVCGKCFFCKTGKAHICENVAILGVDTTGCFAEYVAVPSENVWELDQSIPEEIAAIHDPVGNAVHATLIDEVAGRDVLVTGCGPIGLAAIAIARHVGAAQIIATDINPYRLKLAKEMGADHILNPKELDIAQAVQRETENRGVDVLLEMSGNTAAINQGLKMLKGGGWVSFLGLPTGKVELDLSNGLIFKGAKAYGINGRLMYDTWYQMNALLKTGLSDKLEPLITHKFALDNYGEAFELALEGQTGKIILYP